MKHEKWYFLLCDPASNAVWANQLVTLAEAEAAGAQLWQQQGQGTARNGARATANGTAEPSSAQVFLCMVLDGHRLHSSGSSRIRCHCARHRQDQGGHTLCRQLLPGHIRSRGMKLCRQQGQGQACNGTQAIATGTCEISGAQGVCASWPVGGRLH